VLHRIRNWINVFFGFSRTETNGFLILLPLTGLILFSQPIYEYWLWHQPVDHTADHRKLDSLVRTLKWPDTDTLNPARPAIEFIAFDPNRVKESELVRLGLSKYVAHRVVNYREKGGSFRRKEDLLHIYGMDTAWYQRALPWMRIQKKEEKFIYRKRAAPPKQIALLDINLADSVQLTDVYGIGPSLSRRIRVFRDRLGGFVSMNQLYEVYGLDSVVVTALKKQFEVKEGFIPRAIPLNTSSLEDLTRHPYIRRREAQAILAYRLQHGAFQSVEDLRKITLVTEDWINKMIPYIRIP
jgi:competence protein ComEA